jgi:hypothetical protein
MDNQARPRIRFATSPYFVVMLIVWPVVMAGGKSLEGEDFPADVLILLLTWWLLATAGSILNCRKWKRLDFSSRFGVAVLGILWLAPIFYFVYGGIVWLFWSGVSEFL